MAISTNQSTWLKDLILLTCIIALFFGLFLGNLPLGVPDEARYAEIPREMLVLHDYITPHLNGVIYFEKPVLFYWLQTIALKFLGLSEWAARLPNALFALLGCLITYASGRILFDRRTGWLASLILATSVLYFGMAHIVTIDMTFSVLLSASLFSFLIASQNVKHKRWFCYCGYAFAALATLAKGLVGIIFPGAIIFLWLLFLNKWRLLREFYLPSGIIIFLLIAAPWHILAQLKNPAFFQFYFIDQHFLRYFTQAAGRYKPAWFFIPVLVGGFLPWISLLPQAIYFHWPRKTLSIQLRQIYLFLLCWPTFIFLFFSFSDSKLVTYLLPIFPALALLVGHYLANYWQAFTMPKNLRWGYFMMLILIALLSSIALIGVSTHLFKQNLIHLKPLVLGISLIWLGGLLIANKYNWQNKPRLTFTWAAVSTALALVLMLSQNTSLDLGSVKPLTQTLKPLLQKDSEVVAYQTYYQDLPYYLEQRITVVDWRGELKFGMQQQDTSAWMINTTTFWQRWQSDKRIFVLMQIKTYQNLTKTTAYRFYPIAQTANTILLTNQPL